MAFIKEPEPPRGVPLDVLPGIRRIVAPNPSPMTYHGTNTYLVETADGILVLDPGPDDGGHVAAILAAAGERICGIVLSHGHHDHAGALPALKAATGAPTYGFAPSIDPNFVPDRPLADGDALAGWTAIHTPGHAADHLSFARDDGVVFTADHIMGWSTSVVGPPHGDMAQYFASLQRMIDRDDRLYLPGHGPRLAAPRAFVENLLRHRLAREAAILRAIEAAPRDTQGLVDALYSQVNPTLRRAAERNVVAHLHKLAAEGRARHDGGAWRAA